MMTSVSAHKDKGRPIIMDRGSRKGTQMSDGMARCLQEVEGPVAEEVIGFEAANLQAARLERNFPDYSTLRIAVKHNGIAAPRPTRPRSCVDAGSYNEVGAWWELGYVPDMVEVVVRPDDGLDIGATDVEAVIVRIEHRCHIGSWRDHCSCLDERDHFGCVVLPVWTDTEVEDHVLATI